MPLRGMPQFEREANVRKRLIYTGLAAVAIAVLTAGSSVVADGDSGGNRFRARLIGFEENPSVSSTGRGRLELRLNEDAETIHFKLTYSDIEGGGPNVAHIHFSAQRVNGGVVTFFCGGGTKPAPCPPVSGTVEGDITPADIGGPAAQGIEPASFAEFVRALRAGYTYANAHSTRWPGGEIRGQIRGDGDDDDDDDRGDDHAGAHANH